MASEELTIKVDTETPLPGGEKMIRGSLLHANNYYTSGNELNLANYLDSSGYPTVVIAPADGYVFEHSQGTAEAGLVQAFYTVVNAKNGADDKYAMGEVDANTDLSSVNMVFYAVGKAY